ncbi:MAG: hypothetical protein P8013_06795 [Candidatus Sulfobium sp.]|jgi:hypothetical protein
MNRSGFSTAPLKPALFVLFFLIFIPASASRSADDGAFQFRKVSELQRIQPKKPVRIKLKRSVRGVYSWELSGDDAREILKVDRQLRQVLKPDGRVNADR